VAAAPSSDHNEDEDDGEDNDALKLQRFDSCLMIWQRTIGSTTCSRAAQRGA
jgi:hypothetical protein